jgi:antitoxin (DNA-binding transcriptional repressor) of toxin-antitoxin stability system
MAILATTLTDLTSLLSESCLIHMKTITVRELRTAFPKIETMLLNGEEVAITKRGRTVALLVQPEKRRPKRKLNFKRRFGETVKSKRPQTDVVGLLLRERGESI